MGEWVIAGRKRTPPFAMFAALAALSCGSSDVRGVGSTSLARVTAAVRRAVNHELPLPPGVTAWRGPELDQPTDDLAPLWALIGNARVIGLGESIHTSGGYYATKERLIRALIEEHGVRWFAIESPRTRVEKLEAYVAHGPCDQSAREVLGRVIYPEFADDHTAALLRWICERNRTQPISCTSSGSTCSSQSST